MQRHLQQTSLVLSSSSASRRELLTRLQIAFTCTSPDVDETPLAGETAQALVERLAILKAKTSAAAYPQAIIIGADQVGVVDNIILGKPLTHEAAKQTLELVSNKSVRFYTGVCVYHAATQQCEVATEIYDVSFRELSADDIEHYLQLEQPLHCAGSFHVEGLGITLIRELRGADYTGLIGLPLIRLTAMLKMFGLDVLDV